ncbi:hypothetical protein GF327_05280, partial [Candidatus Woesearchaeota archaeon]|nr:hypothetical protein [Candidatus Woesearchaeota archaeon]
MSQLDDILAIFSGLSEEERRLAEEVSVEYNKFKGWPATKKVENAPFQRFEENYEEDLNNAFDGYNTPLSILADSGIESSGTEFRKFGKAAGILFAANQYDTLRRLGWKKITPEKYSSLVFSLDNFGVEYEADKQTTAIDLALDLSEKVIQRAKKLDLAPITLRARERQTLIYSALAYHELSENKLEAALDYFSDLKDSFFDLCENQIEAADTKLKVQLYQMAAGNYQNIISLNQKLGIEFDIDSLLEKAQGYSEKSLTQVDIMEQALYDKLDGLLDKNEQGSLPADIFKRWEDIDIWRANNYHTQGVIAQYREDYEKAVDLYQKSLAQLENVDRPLQKAAINLRIADAESSKDSPDNYILLPSYLKVKKYISDGNNFGINDPNY